MPEGDTIFRTARTLRTWLGGRQITKVESRVQKVPAEVIQGRTLEAVESRGKHLLMRFAGGVALHTHMKMTGSWHVYSAGDRWRRPNHEARLILESDDRQAVCFNAPVVELLDRHQEANHPSLATLGPDVLVDPLDLAEVRRRARAATPDTAVGEVILNQSVVAGIGNIYRCEALFACRVDPWLAIVDVSDDDLDRLIQAAARLMRRNLPAAQGFGRDFGGGADRPYVYGRARRPCLRCRTPIRVARMGGVNPRDLWWCPSCQSGRPGVP